MKYSSTVNSQLTIIIPSFRTHRSVEQFDRSTLFIYFLDWKIASYTIKKQAFSSIF